jgi:hypothetical protein
VPQQINDPGKGIFIMHFLVLFRALAIAALYNLLLISATAAAVPTDGQLDFTVMRDGKEIGNHQIQFRQDTDSLSVDIKTDVAVKILFITAYRFEHHGTEIWRDDRLVALKSVTNDDGTPHDLEAQADKDSLSVMGDGSASRAEANIIPASLWHESILQGGDILNTLHGKKWRSASVITANRPFPYVATRSRPGTSSSPVILSESCGLTATTYL